MHYVYLLRSLSNPRKTYVGMTCDVDARLRAHNGGRCAYTDKHRPWELIASIGVRTRDKASALERYLKAGSGHAFARRHFW